MSKKARDYLFFIFIIFFVIMTVGISLYASGYKFNLSWPLKLNRILQKTGMLAVATEPPRATVFLNDKPQKDLSLKPWKKDYLVTPTKIKNLLPGEYELRFEVEGYWPYKQKIRINSGETTFVEDVNLFKENLPILVLAVPGDSVILSQDKKFLYVKQAKTIINLKTENARKLNFPENFSGVWLKNNKLMASGIIFDPTKDANDQNFAISIGATATNWYYEDSTGRLYYKNNNSINRLETNSKTVTLLISGGSYLDYLPIQDQLFTISSSSNQIQLENYSLRTFKRESVWSLPNNGHYTFTKDIDTHLAVFDDQNKTLYLFNSAKISQGPMTIKNVKKWTNLNSQSLIYTNGFEIYVYNFQNNRSDLVTRRSEEIDDLIWNEGGKYLIFSSPTTLNVLDFKNKNTTLLFKTEKINSPALDDKNNNLYFWAQVGQQEGVYKMIMQ